MTIWYKPNNTSADLLNGLFIIRMKKERLLSIHMLFFRETILKYNLNRSNKLSTKGYIQDQNLKIREIKK